MPPPCWVRIPHREEAHVRARLSPQGADRVLGELLSFLTTISDAERTRRRTAARPGVAGPSPVFSYRLVFRDAGQVRRLRAYINDSKADRSIFTVVFLDVSP